MHQKKTKQIPREYLTLLLLGATILKAWNGTEWDVVTLKAMRAKIYYHYTRNVEEDFRLVTLTLPDPMK